MRVFDLALVIFKRFLFQLGHIQAVAHVFHLVLRGVKLRVKGSDLCVQDIFPTSCSHELSSQVLCHFLGNAEFFSSTPAPGTRKHRGLCAMSWFRFLASGTVAPMPATGR